MLGKNKKKETRDKKSSLPLWFNKIPAKLRTERKR